MEMQSSLPLIEVAYFNCPHQICSSVSRVFDVDGMAVKLVCSLRHVYWMPIGQLVRVNPYWPSTQGSPDGDVEDHAERPALAREGTPSSPDGELLGLRPTEG